MWEQYMRLTLTEVYCSSERKPRYLTHTYFTAGLLRGPSIVILTQRFRRFTPGRRDRMSRTVRLRVIMFWCDSDPGLKP